jgi:hypothetical protein
VYVKAINTLGISVSSHLDSEYTLRAYFRKKKKMSRRSLAENLFTSGSGSGCFQKSDPDPVKKIVGIRSTALKEQNVLISPIGLGLKD